MDNNIIYVAQGTNHSMLHTNLVFTSKPHWIHSQPDELANGDVFDCEFKFQHTQTWIGCQVYETHLGLIIYLSEYKRAVTPGQYAVLSKHGECLGSAKIANSGVSHFSLFYLENNEIEKVHSTSNKCKIKTELDKAHVFENIVQISLKN